MVRDGLGRYEDKFFASVFLGSGLLFLAMIFVSSAVGVALVASRGADYGADVHVFGQALLIALSKTYALRMAAVFMMSLATIWLKTGLVSRGLVIFTYVVALTLLVASDVTVWLTLAFPVWVLIVLSFGGQFGRLGSRQLAGSPGVARGSATLTAEFEFKLGQRRHDGGHRTACWCAGVHTFT